MSGRCCDADRPMAGAAHVGGTALLEGLEGADLVALVVMRSAGRLNKLAELVVEAGFPEVALLLGNPFLQPEMRLDHELAHFCNSCIRRVVMPIIAPRQWSRQQECD